MRIQKPSQKKKLGYALVGLGSLSKNQIAPAFQKTQYCKLAGLVSGTPAKLKEWSIKYNIPQKNLYNYENFNKIAENPDIDIVYIVLPNSMHAKYSIHAAKAGKHVLCEKPMGNSVKECKEMISVCQKAKKQLAIGYRLHFEPHNLETMRLGQEKVFGPVKIIEASHCFHIGDPNQWRLKKALAGGGALMDVGIYAIQAARYVTGEEPISVSAQEFKTDHEKFREVDETIFFQLQFPSGAIANCGTSYTRYINRLYVTAKDGRFKLEPAYTYDGIEGWSSEGKMNFPQIDQFAAEMDDFANCILANKPTRISGDEGLKDLKVIEAIYNAIKIKKEVKLM
jgi:predicted dehydrogenase